MKRILALALLILGAVVLLIRRQLVIVTVTGDSMRPGLRPGEHVLVQRTDGNTLQVGDVAVFRLPRPPDGKAPETGFIIKRVVGLPGDSFINQQTPHAQESLIPPGHVYILGDNSHSSTDSRHFGTVPLATALGVVKRKIASFRPGPRPKFGGRRDCPWNGVSGPTPVTSNRARSTRGSATAAVLKKMTR